MEGLIASAGRDGNEMDRRCRRGGQKENEREDQGRMEATILLLSRFHLASFMEKKNNKRTRGSPLMLLDAGSHRIELAISNRTSLQRLR